MSLLMLICVYHSDAGLHQFFVDAVPDLQMIGQPVDRFHDAGGHCVILLDFCPAARLSCQVFVTEEPQRLQFRTMVRQPFAITQAEVR